MTRSTRPARRTTVSRATTALVMALALGAAAGAACAEEMHEHGVHVHGAVSVNIALEGRKLFFEIEAPADQVLGFERAPRDARERAAVEAADAWFRSGRGMLGVPAAAGCRLAKAEFTPPTPGGEHNDYGARYFFDCAAPEALAWAEIWALRRLQGLERTEVDLAVPGGQRQETLVDGAVRVALR